MTPPQGTSRHWRLRTAEPWLNGASPARRAALTPARLRPGPGPGPGPLPVRRPQDASSDPGCFCLFACLLAWVFFLVRYQKVLLQIKVF